MAKKRCLMIGAGGIARMWIRDALTPFHERMEIVGLVDINEEPLNEQGDFLELDSSARFTDADEAFKQVGADFCIICTPPWVHKENALMAAEKGMDILSEKPIADTWEAAADIYRGVTDAGVKMEVIQNYRYNPTQLTIREVLRSRRLGATNYVMGRFAADYRRFGSWGEFRHRIPHSLLVEGGVHHFDMLRNLAEADCRTITGFEWNPHWSSFDGESSALCVLDMTNGVKACYEGNCNAAGTQNVWHREHYRAECEAGAVTVDADQKVRIHEHAGDGTAKVTEVPLAEPEHVGHSYQINEFLDWLDGGPEPDTVLSENIKSVATMFAAIVASGDRTTVDVGEMVASANGAE